MPVNLVSKSQRLEIALGGQGEQEAVDLVIRGCQCRTTDFVLALIAFAKDWRIKSDAADLAKTPVVTTDAKPCGCGDPAPVVEGEKQPYLGPDSLKQEVK